MQKQLKNHLDHDASHCLLGWNELIPQELNVFVHSKPLGYSNNTNVILNR